MLIEDQKNKDKFDDKAQNYALRYAQEKILIELGQLAKEYIFEHNRDINGWIAIQVEATIYSLKNRTYLI